MIETKRLILRPLAPRDEEPFFSGVADGELRRLYGLPATLDEDRARRLFRQFSALPAAFGLVRQRDDALVGFLLDVPAELPEETLRALPAGGRTLAYTTFAPYQRQGYMGEALRALVGDYRQSRSAPYLHGGHFPFNEPSRRLLQALGFSEYGRHPRGDAVIVDEILFLP